MNLPVITRVLCDTCHHETLGDASGTMAEHHNLDGWPRDKGIGAAPMCTGTTGRVTASRSMTYDDTTGRYHSVTVEL